jgi:2-C-methyl-D-erythritol 4-phosphate cytidylyltransferase
MDQRAAAIIVAGGSGTRFGGPVNKVYRDLDGTPVLRWSLKTLANLFGHVVVVSRPADAELLAPVVAGFDVSHAAGGPSRTESERSGLEALRTRIERGDVDVVAIHDGARPFVTEALVSELIQTARHVGGAVPGYPISTGSGVQDGSATYEMPGHGRVSVQTPQVFRAAELLQAFDQAPGFEAADTASLIRTHSDLDIALVLADATNRKITFPDDLG